ncbi:hypothetical protein GLAREA_06243 [Glarea lozoyensis ATCC 20868]|uniref:Uncharacterized protein n=1 Tax=Glarea lozoyensis (strain ATCC 20868 / MF5171) TaxID=1116229 RepID=S3DMC0_GLAL2|nr:uncharacterized protein GLAREA_06243 [Glarea lozoyensis ATCC 20868]EPE33231.1 hypothetical protein GLAREA_06243 [Glarea lozoyensis ATCC 20868]
MILPRLRAEAGKGRRHQAAAKEAYVNWKLGRSHSSCLQDCHISLYSSWRRFIYLAMYAWLHHLPVADETDRVAAGAASARRLLRFPASEMLDSRSVERKHGVAAASGAVQALPVILTLLLFFRHSGSFEGATSSQSRFAISSAPSFPQTVACRTANVKSTTS